MSEIETESIVCAGGLPAFVALPAGQEPAPVIVLLHERYGLVDHTRDLTKRHAREGYVCIAADYFYKHPDQAALHKGDSAYNIADAEAMASMEAAIEALRGEPRADLSRIAVMGVCQTGRHPLVFAAQRPIAAALVWYGAAQDREWETNERFPVALDELVAKAQCPVLGLFGERDHIISIDHVRRFRNSLERHNKSFHVELYAGAPHGWLNDTMPGRYRRAEAEAAWATQRAFLAAAFDPARDKSAIKQIYRAELSATYDFSKNERYE